MRLSAQLANFVGKTIMIMDHRGYYFAGTVSKTLDQGGESVALVLDKPYSLQEIYATRAPISIDIGAPEITIFVDSIAYIAQPEWINDGPWAVKKEN